MPIWLHHSWTKLILNRFTNATLTRLAVYCIKLCSIYQNRPARTGLAFSGIYYRLKRNLLCEFLARYRTGQNPQRFIILSPFRIFPVITLSSTHIPAALYLNTLLSQRRFPLIQTISNSHKPLHPGVLSWVFDKYSGRNIPGKFYDDRRYSVADSMHKSCRNYDPLKVTSCLF